MFAARPSEPISEDMALSYWLKVCAGNPQLAQFTGPVALGMYRSLGEKRVLARRNGCNSQGFAIREELGISGAFGYLFGQDTRPDYRLVLMSIPEAESHSHSFAQPVVAP